jgi:hypothetical protein
MALKTKVKFVAEMVRDNPESSRETIINKIARHPIAYRGKKFTKRTAARYYWYVTTKMDQTTNKNSRLVSLYFRKNTDKYERLAYAINVLTKAGILND